MQCVLELKKAINIYMNLSDRLQNKLIVFNPENCNSVIQLCVKAGVK